MAFLWRGRGFLGLGWNGEMKIVLILMRRRLSNGYCVLVMGWDVNVVFSSGW